MSTAAERFLGFFWAQSLVERAVFSIVLALSGWLKERAPHRWRLVVRAHDPGGAQGSRSALPDAPEPFYRKSPENLSGNGSSGDTASYFELVPDTAARPLLLPDWAKEISPFL